MDYVDSSVLIGAYFPTDPNHERCKTYMEEVKSGKIKVITSIFSLAEIGGFISRNSTVEDALKYVKELVKIPNLYLWSTFSSSEVKRVVSLDKDFKKVKDLIEILIL